MTGIAPPVSVLEQQNTLPIRASQEALNAFAELTGDRSSLHVNDAFARRSAYRQQVVHGMLPLAFLPLLEPFQVAGFQCVLVAVSGRFASPVFVGDSVALIAGPGHAKESSGEVDFDYRVERSASHESVTTGTLTVKYAPEPPAPAPSPGGNTPGLLIDPTELKAWRFDQIERGLRDDLRFRVSANTLEGFAALLVSGLGGRDVPSLAQLASRTHLPNLLALLLLSTSVGVNLPGASATFLEFSARYTGAIEPGRTYRLEAAVTHRSGATRIVRKSVSIADVGGGQPLATGKVAALVNNPPSAVPSMQALRQAALDPGLRGKVVLITGASRGIGEAAAKLFALAEARVVVNYHRGADDAARIIEEIRAEGGDAIALPGDVTQEDAVRDLVNEVVTRYGPVDVLVNNAARDFLPIPFLKLTWDEVQRDIDVIARGAFYCCQAVIPSMLAQGGGRIINVSTIATDDPPADHAKYVMAKSALVGLTRSLAVEFAARNIQVNMVVPNFVETDFVAHVPEGFRTKIAADTPMRRLASTVDVARAIVFLASAQASFTTGQKLMVTGGAPPYL